MICLTFSQFYYCKFQANLIFLNLLCAGKLGASLGGFHGGLAFIEMGDLGMVVSGLVKHDSSKVKDQSDTAPKIHYCTRKINLILH